MNKFISHPYSKLCIRKIKESEAYLAILSILSVNFVINRIKGHQADVKLRKDRTIAEQLNVDADKIATTCAKIPINIHLPSAPFAIHIKRDYVHLPLYKRIREVSFEDDAKKFYKPNITGTLLLFKISNGKYIRFNSINFPHQENIASQDSSITVSHQAIYCSKLNTATHSAQYLHI